MSIEEALQFDVYRRGSGSRLGAYYTGITQSGTITFYTGFYNLEKLNVFQNILLMYDKEKEVIGIKFLKEKEEGAMRINHKEKNATVTAPNFFRYYGINLENCKGKYKPEKYQDGVYVVKLQEKLS